MQIRTILILYIKILIKHYFFCAGIKIRNFTGIFKDKNRDPKKNSAMFSSHIILKPQQQQKQSKHITTILHVSY